MDLILFIIATSTLLYLFFSMIEFKIGLRQIKNLFTQEILPQEKLPSVSIIFSALNEESALAESMQSMLKIHYPKLEIIAVNDRSTDKTGLILDGFKNYQNIQIKHIHHLAKGWLGKNHALHFASQFATADWLLFTDADVLMHPDTIAKAMSYALQKQLDHLTIYEHHLRKGFWLKTALFGTYITYMLAMRPWRVRYNWSKRSLGHGAFNLVKKSAYLKSGGHQAIAMECLDDLKLGALIKNNGFKQDTVDGRDFVAREWYGSVKEVVNGFQKNAFAFFNFNFLTVCRDFIFALIFFIWPCIAVFTQSGMVFLLNVINVLLMIYISTEVATHFRLPKWFALFYPLGIGLLLYTIWHSVMSAYKNNGIIWRDTYYSLHELRCKK